MTARRVPSRHSPDRPVTRVLRACLYALAAVVLLVAVTLGGLRVSLPKIGYYRVELGQWVSRITERQVELGTIDAYWHGWTPVFRFGDVRLAGGRTTDRGGPEPSIRLAALTFSVDLLESLRSGAPQLRGITASGASLVVVRRSDGTFSVHKGGERSLDEPHAWGGLMQWVLERSNISLLSSQILWIDERHGKPALPITGVTVHLEQVSGRYRVAGAFELPEAGRIDFAVETEGDLLSPSWTGNAYIAARDVDIDHLGLDARPLGAEAFSGLVSGTVWSTWRGARLVEAEGTVRVQSPGVTSGGRWRGFDEVSASLKVERTLEGWTLAAEDLVVATPDGSWPRSRAVARWTVPEEGDDGMVVVRTEFVRIEDLVALISPDGEPSGDSGLDTLVKSALHGVIEDLHVSAPIGDRIEIGRARVRGRFIGLRLDLEGRSVSLDAATGRFEASEDGAVVDVATGELHVDAPRWLAHPLRGERLSGAFTAIPAPEGIRFRLEGGSLSTPAGMITGGGSMLAPRDGSDPELSATISLGTSRIATVRTLMADRALPEPVSSWLEAAAPDGDIHSARLTYHGRLTDAPFGPEAGKLEAAVELALPVLHYAPGWPEITDVSGVVRFNGSRLDARVDSGRIFGSNVRTAKVTIADLGAAVRVMRIDGNVEGTSTDAVQFLAESPLQARFAPMIEGFPIRGDATLDLGITLPLKHGDRSVTVEGKVTLDDNQIDVPGLDQGLKAVNGLIVFRGGAIESDRVTATLQGEPLHATIGPSPLSAYATRLSIDGRLTPRLLAALLLDAGVVETPLPADSALLGRLHGDTAWSSTLDLPRSGTGEPARLRITSELRGLSLDLPPPFGKESGTTRMLAIESSTRPGMERTIEIRYGDLASAVLLWVRDAARSRLDRGALRIGAGEAMLPDTPGLTVQGTVPELDTTLWRALLDDLPTLDASTTDGSPFDHLREVSIDAGLATVAGSRFPDTRMRATRSTDGGWRIDLAGRHLEGSVHLPRDRHAGQVTADFERIVFDLGSSDSDFSDLGNDDPRIEPGRLDPRTLPALSFSARHFVLGEHDLGAVRIVTAPSEAGMRLESLDVRAEPFQSEATGSWSLDGSEHRTELVMRVHGDHLGRMLDRFGFDGGVVAGGITDISLRGSWPGAPTDFSLDRLTGLMHFLSKDGRLTRIERGVTGRVFGLLSITSLPRRLILDFSDLFKDGFEYDRIDGSFAIENGHAYTDDLFMESDTARLEVVGRTGLATEDYDKLVTVIPKISSSLPFLPIWVAEKILNRNVFDKAFSYQYTITGPWDEPEVELVRARSREEDGTLK